MEGLNSPGLFLIRAQQVGMGSLHSRAIRCSGENMLKVRLCAQRRVGQSRPQSGKALRVGFVAVETRPAPGGGSASHTGRERPTDCSCWLSCPALPSLAPSRHFLAREACWSSKKLPPAGCSGLVCLSAREVALALRPALRFEQCSGRGPGELCS